MDISTNPIKVLARNSSLNKSRPHVPVLLAVLFMLIALLPFTMSSEPAYAVDELYLTGTIKSIDQKAGLVYMEVTTASCRGMKTFRADQRLDTLEIYVNQVISFYIDSSTCEEKANHTILVSWGIKK